MGFYNFAKSVACPAVLLGVAVVASSANAGNITGSPVATFTNGATQVLSTGSPVFNADLSSWSNFSGQLHHLLGVGDVYPGTADVEYQDSGDVNHGISGPYAMAGRRANGQCAHFLWKFTLPAGYQTGPNAKVNADVYFYHDPNDGTQGSNALIGILDHVDVYSDFSGPSNYPPGVKVTAKDLFGPGHGYGIYTGPATLSIPAGMTEFFVDFTEQESSARWAFTSLSVNGDPVAVPEPASLGMLALVGLAIRRSRR